MFKNLILGLLCITFVCAEYEEEGHVLVLHDSDFPAVFEDFPNILIQFYAPWCGHCKKLVPVYTEVADKLHAEELNVRVAKVDATVEKKIAGEYKVQGYPTLIYFSNGEKIDYNGQRTTQYMFNWLKKRVSDAVSQLDQQAYAKLSETDKVNLVFHGDIASEEGIAFEKLAKQDDYNTYFASASLGKDQGSVEMYRPFGDSISYSKVDDNLKNWIQQNERPFVLPFDDRTIGSVFQSGKVAACLFNPEASQELRNAYSSAGQKYNEDAESKLLFTEITKNDQHYVQLAEYIKVRPDEHPIVVIDTAGKNKYVWSSSRDDVTEESIGQFLSNWKQNKYELQAQVKSKTQTVTEDEL